MKLYVDFDEYNTGGELCEGQNPEDSYNSYEEEFVDLTMRKVSFDRGDDFFPADSVEVDDLCKSASRLFLVVARYHDGDTFSSQSGKVWLGPVFLTRKEAEEYDPEVGASKYSLPWHGYFSGDKYDDLEVYEFDMENEGVVV